MENANKQVEKFDPSKLMDGVKDRIKATFVSLIPDAQWEQMCNAEMKKFFEPTWGGYDNREKKPSEFEKIVTELMKEQCQSYLKELFSRPEYSVQTIWGNSSYGTSGDKAQLSDHLDKMIKEKMPEMMQAMFTSVMSDAFYSFFSNIQNKVRDPNLARY